MTMTTINMVIAVLIHNGWWFNACAQIDPNRQPPFVHLNSTRYNLLKVEMKIRQVDCITQ